MSEMCIFYDSAYVDIKGGGEKRLFMFAENAVKKGQSVKWVAFNFWNKSSISYDKLNIKHIGIIPKPNFYDEDGNRLEYDIKAQTEACIENIRIILEACEADLSDVIDVTTFLVDMKRDFKGYNEIYAKHFEEIQATRTTLAIQALPTPIAVEMKVIAKAP